MDIADDTCMHLADDISCSEPLFFSHLFEHKTSFILRTKLTYKVILDTIVVTFMLVFTTTKI